MLPTTVDAVRSILTADPTVTPAARAAFVASLRNGTPEPAPRLLRVGEVARMIGRSKRSVYHWQAKGLLQPVVIAGRAAGFREADVLRLIGGEGAPA